MIRSRDTAWGKTEQLWQSSAEVRLLNALAIGQERLSSSPLHDSCHKNWRRTSWLTNTQTQNVNGMTIAQAVSDKRRVRILVHGFK
jgi:hypothetical protein